MSRADIIRSATTHLINAKKTLNEAISLAIELQGLEPRQPITPGPISPMRDTNQSSPPPWRNNFGGASVGTVKPSRANQRRKRHNR